MIQRYPRPIDNIEDSQKYACVCKIVKESKLIEEVDFELNGSQIKELWKRLARVQVPDCNINFLFGYFPEESPLRIIAYDQKKANYYSRILKWPILFPNAGDASK